MLSLSGVVVSTNEALLTTTGVVVSTNEALLMTIANPRLPSHDQLLLNGTDFLCLLFNNLTF
jgi:hypothetical protein